MTYYETGIRVQAAKGGYDYVDVFVTQSEDEARKASQYDRRNYLARLTFEADGCRTEYWCDGRWSSEP
ncbi:MAG: hypothetical protein HFF17_09550 [Oscillospiraceae bacterium]|nr:hypothetical protein [Oscillospiraceae bacterium]